MKTTFIKIVNWFNSERDYNEGVALYNLFSKNKALSRWFRGEENKQRREKLAWELHKIAGLPEKVCYDKAAVSDFFSIRETEKPEHKLHSKKPQPILDLIKEKSKLSMDRDKTHRQMADMPDANDYESTKKRQELCELIEKQTARIQEIHVILDHYDATGEINTNVKPVDPPAPPPDRIIKEGENPDNKLRRITNLRSNRSKAEKKLKDMPDGPKKEKLQKKLADIVRELKELEG